MPPVERITIAGFHGVPVPLDISFLEGRNPKSLILYGRNGTGKSSVTDGWEWLTSAHLAREGAEVSSYAWRRQERGRVLATLISISAVTLTPGVTLAPLEFF